MAKESERFVAYGFGKIKPVVAGNKKYNIEGKTPEEKLKSMSEIKKNLSEEDKKEFSKQIEAMASHEWAETARDQLVLTDYPNALTRMVMTIESWHNSIEPYYFWCMNFLGDIGFPIIHKVTDIFTAAEHSSFYGAGAQRLGLAQDKVAQYLATIGKMVKDLFQLVRELRWIDERMEIYRGALGIDKEGKKTPTGPQKGPELTLKGLWVDLVDGVVGGQRTGSNLFVMAQQLQFTALPDLFFSINPQKVDEVDKIVDVQAKDFNEPLRNLLRRKLTQYIAWKNSSYDELKVRRKFTLDYLNQHYNVIKMYMSWVKPYVKHIERLSGQEELLKNVRLISAFESSLVEIEVIAQLKPAGSKAKNACVLMTFEYHTKPSMQYPGDQGYHRGPVHVGTTQITWRAYDWTDQQIQDYIRMKEQSDLETIASIDNSLKSAMEALGTDLQNYLKEASETAPKTEKKEKAQPIDILEPFAAVGKGFKEVFGGIVPSMTFGKKKKKTLEEASTAGNAVKMCWVHYNIFKKAHGMLSW